MLVNLGQSEDPLGVVLLGAKERCMWQTGDRAVETRELQEPEESSRRAGVCVWGVAAGRWPDSAPSEVPAGGREWAERPCVQAEGQTHRQGGVRAKTGPAR